MIMKKNITACMFLIIVSISFFPIPVNANYPSTFPLSHFEDKDGDGYGVSINGEGISIFNLRQTSDSDDTDETINPAAPDLTIDGIDQNGDGIDGPAFDEYGGWTGMQLAATGNFRVEKIDQKWWFVTPEGHPFYFNGINQFQIQGRPAFYEDQAVYAEAYMMMCQH